MIAVAASRLRLLGHFFCGLTPAAMCYRRYATPNSTTSKLTRRVTNSFSQHAKQEDRMAAKDYSRHQQGIIKRYYDNRESIDGEKLSELVTNLYLSEGKKKEKMWKTAEDIMTRLKVPPERVRHVIASADPAILAEVVKDLQSGALP
jgi:hypothetical protein